MLVTCICRSSVNVKLYQAHRPTDRYDDGSLIDSFRCITQIAA